MAVKTVSTLLVKEKECKSCVRYNSKNRINEDVMLTVYVMNAAVKKLGNPKAIEVTVSVSDSKS